MSLAGGVCCVLLAGFGNVNVSEYAIPLWLGVLAGILVACLCGAFNGFLVAGLKIQPMVATLILYSAGRAIGLLLCNSNIVYINVESFKFFGGYCWIFPTPILITVLCIAVTALVLKFTALGTYVQAVGINKGSRPHLRLQVGGDHLHLLCGVRPVRGHRGHHGHQPHLLPPIPTTSASTLKWTPSWPWPWAATAWAAAKFRLSGSIIGAYTIQAITTTLYALGVSSAQAPVFKAIIVILIVTIQSPAVKAYFAKRAAVKNAMMNAGRGGAGMIHAKPAVKEKEEHEQQHHSAAADHRPVCGDVRRGPASPTRTRGFTKLQTFLDILKNNAGLIS